MLDVMNIIRGPNKRCGWTLCNVLLGWQIQIISVHVGGGHIEIYVFLKYGNLKLTLGYL
jgi:hypothetical protein